MPPSQPEPGAEPPSWAGAAGYHPSDDAGTEPEPTPGAPRPGYQAVPEGSAPHAPMPGSPPYPAAPPPGPASAHRGLGAWLRSLFRGR